MGPCAKFFMCFLFTLNVLQVAIICRIVYSDDEIIRAVSAGFISIVGVGLIAAFALFTIVGFDRATGGADDGWGP